MEREGPRSFSIEPYVDGGGMMGNLLEVDQKAASSIMRRTALRRDVLVSKEVLTRVFFWCGVSWIIYKGSEAFLYALSPETSIDNSIDLWTSFSMGAGGLILGGYISDLFENLAENYGEEGIIHAKEKFLPNIPIPSTLACGISLALNSGKLIGLKQKE